MTLPTEVKVAELIIKTEKQRQGLIVYLHQKADEQDWHGVADAAMDIREKEAILLALR